MSLGSFLKSFVKRNEEPAAKATPDDLDSSSMGMSDQAFENLLKEHFGGFDTKRYGMPIKQLMLYESEPALQARFE